jgi:outer membrane receptor protein involved in Fe transport
MASGVPCALALLLALVAPARPAGAEPARVSGVVRDAGGAPLAEVLVQLRPQSGPVQKTTSDGSGTYRFATAAPGVVQLTFALVNFATHARRVTLSPSESLRVDVTLQLALSADLTVVGKSALTNLADVSDPAQNLVGVAQSASQGAITARQLDARPIMRTGEVLETVPGVVISQHSGEGKANQYYLRGFNLDHGTDFATTVAGIPVNLPTNGHGQGYSDLNFLIPELVSGVQYSKGPYFADQGDFATAGAANVTYASVLPGPLVRVSGGSDMFGRLFAAASPSLGSGHLLVALDLDHNDGPWDHPDDYRKFNAVVRYSRGDAGNGLSVTGMGYHGRWNSTDQIPERAVQQGLIDRYGAIDPTDGGDSYRYSGSLEWQRTKGATTTKLTAFGLLYDLNLFSNFTYFLDDPVNGDQFHQADHRVVSGARATWRRVAELGGHPTENTAGLQLRNDDITDVALQHTKARALLETIRQDAVVETSAGVYAQNETSWTPWLRTLGGIRLDGYRFDVESSNPLNSGVTSAGRASPKGGIVIGPFDGTEFYVNGGLGFHSNDARGTTITVDPVSGAPVDRVTPLVRATGAEIGARTVRIPHLQTSVSLWRLDLASELVFSGDAGTTEAGRPSHRHGIEIANYCTPRPWLIFDLDVSISRARFIDDDPAGSFVPGAVQTVVSFGATVDEWRRISGSVRWRYLGPRPLIEDNSVESQATSLVNLEGGYRLTRSARLALDVFNLFNAPDSDIDYYYASRLPGEPASGVEDIHFHPALPRSARVSLVLGF